MVRFERGQLLLLRHQAAPIGIHWSLVAGLALLSRFTFNLWFCLGYIGLILVHEFGHVVLVRGLRLEVEAVMLSGLGGECTYSGAVTHRKRGIIAWGGVTAQAIVLAVVLVAGLVVPPDSGGWAQLYATLTRTNVLLIAVNLLPIRGLDGFHAWKLFAEPPRAVRPRHATVDFGHAPVSLVPTDNNLLRFPTERVNPAPPPEAGTEDALEEVNAQILEITERVNQQHSGSED